MLNGKYECTCKYNGDTYIEEFTNGQLIYGGDVLQTVYKSIEDYENLNRSYALKPCKNILSITEIDWSEGALYKDSMCGRDWKVVKGELIADNIFKNLKISKLYTQKNIVNMKFIKINDNQERIDGLEKLINKYQKELDSIK